MCCHDSFQTQYGNPLIYVTENGASQRLHCTQLCDEWRIQYLKGYTNEMLKGKIQTVFTYLFIQLGQNLITRLIKTVSKSHK